MTEASGTNIIQLFLQAGPTARIVLGLLGAFSLASWTIILSKVWSFSRAAADTRAFLVHFRKSRKFADVLGICDRYPSSPLIGVFRAGYTELDQQIKAGREVAPADTGRLFVKSLAAIERALERAGGVETTRLTKFLPFLATTASATPFVGLFGTVWGIMGSFRQIGLTGSTSIVTVAPGISEALVNTAAGLVAAVPALIAYNYFNGRLKVLRAEIRDFALEFLNLAERHFT
ncbi:MAG: MotA/TolQ/ExbB proton channel family protein [Acidobacteria bacterium]|nr:MotA/TolQ/ExbB proton channel family protein [Acidobacteriota bacterium]MCG3194350.1 Protein TolQ [Thermoanaerobaculia bacterium]MCK6682541.1 MotA/TolQ/ExbB proton channel family protein [Thermoanaerobaculia bacterium]